MRKQFLIFIFTILSFYLVYSESDKIDVNDFEYKKYKFDKCFAITLEVCNIYNLENNSLVKVGELDKYLVVLLIDELQNFKAKEYFYKIIYNNSEYFVNIKKVEIIFSNDYGKIKNKINFFKDIYLYNEPEFQNKTNVQLESGERFEDYGIFHDKKNNNWMIIKINNTFKFIDYNDFTRINNFKYNISLGFYLFGVIFPVTNILGFTYYGHNGVTGNFSAELGSIIYYPFLVPSALSFIASISLFIPSSIIYNFNFENPINIGLFTESIVCLGISYLINLVAGIIYYSICKPKESNKINKNLNNFIDVGYNCNTNSFMLSMNLKL